jgi:hypothetical protein
MVYDDKTEENTKRSYPSNFNMMNKRKSIHFRNQIT